MPKRYHQSMKDRMHESRGEYNHHRDMHNDEMKHEKDHMRRAERNMYRLEAMKGREHYAGADPRRRQEMEDAGMIREDHSAMANLPQQVIMRPYPNRGSYMPEDLDDTIRGVDRQIGYDDYKRSEHMYPKKV